MTVASVIGREHVAPVALVGGAKVLGGVSMVLLNLWVAQHLSPSAYGVFAIASTGLLLTDGVVGSALDAAVIRAVGGVPGRDATAAERTGLILKLLAGAILCAGLAGATLAFGTPAIRTIALLTGIGGTGLLVHRSLLVYLQLRERFGWYTIAEIGQTALRCGCVVVALMAGSITATAAIGGYALAPWLTALAAQGLVSGFWLRRSAQSDGVDAVKRFAWASLATTGVGAIVARMDILLIGAAADAREAGIFGAASTLALVPTWIGAYLAPALSARILPYCRERRMLRFLGDVQRALVILALAGTAIGIAVAPIVVERFLPVEYADVGGIVAVLLIGGGAGFVTFPLVLHTLLFLSPRTYLVMDLVSLPILVPAYVLAAQRYGALGVAWVTAVSAVVKACVAQAAAVAAVRQAEAKMVAA